MKKNKFMHKKGKLFIIFTFFLFSSCKNDTYCSNSNYTVNQTTSDVSPLVSFTNKKESSKVALSSSETTTDTKIEMNDSIIESGISEHENNDNTKNQWIKILDLDSADYSTGSDEYNYNFWTDSCLMRYSNGVYYTETDHDQFFSESENQKNDFSAPIQIFVGDEFNGLKVTAAQFVVLGTKNFNFASISFSGCAVLKGVLFIRNEDDPYMGINEQGDVWFFPYPESIEQYPLCFAPQDYFSACFDEISFHIFADTPQLYLGNEKDGKLDTRINEIQLSTWSVDDVDWTLNSKLREMLQSNNYQFICYEAELEISEIKLLYYEDFMTGSPRSSANISRVVNLSPLK